jgi:hypothetical protein
MTYLGITCRAPITCNNDAEFIIIYGCWEGHLSELATCNHCALVWVDITRDGRTFCNCGRRIGNQHGTDYELLHLTQITEQYMHEYVLNTAGHIRDPYTNTPWNPNP